MRRGAVNPLLEAGLSKEDVRRLAKDAGLPVWDKPAAACLSSRIPHGTRVTLDALARVERAETALKFLGYDIVRVRHLGDTARVELPLPVVLALRSATRDKIRAAVVAAGHRDVVIDERGYRTGGANLLRSAGQDDPPAVKSRPAVT